jgi:hypothetical protein
VSTVHASFRLARVLLFDVMLDENPRAQVARLAREIERLRQDAGFWQRSGKPETARELRALVVLLEGTVERIERRLLRAGRRGVPSLFDP